MPETLEIKRGGYAVAFIYIALYILVAFVAKQLQITNAYFFMVAAVITVIAGYFLTPWVFKKPVIQADKYGLHTKKLGDVMWNDVSRIYILREPRFSTKGLNKVDIYLCIEIHNNQTERFNAMFLENGEDSGKDLIAFWQKNTSV
ncbi:MAG: hypothetical protein MH137_00705 [Flavobacteriales bacterium]|nr:hypothetical protein [Flavobacteriales bacterium]